MNIYIGKKDAEIVTKLQAEAKRRKRSICYLVKEALRKAYGLGNGNGD
jgi:hypothetical protein